MADKRYFILEKNQIDRVIDAFIKRFGLPEIIPNLVIYAKKNNLFLEINFQNEECTFRSYNKNSKRDNKYLNLFHSLPPINIENKNIKFFLKIFQDLDISEAYIGNEVFKIEFKKDKKPIASLKENTLIGNILTINKEVSLKDIFLESVKIKEIDSKDIEPLVIKKNSLSRIFDEHGLLNNKIVRYANNFGIDLGSSESSSIKLRTNFKSNDYSYCEYFFRRILGVNFQSKKKLPIKLKEYFKPI